MGHRAEKQMYGSMKKAKAAKTAGKFVEPGWKEPKIGRLTSPGRREWKQRHLLSNAK